MGDEPCFFFAAPGDFGDPFKGIPLNASNLLREWEFGLDPIGSVRAQAKRLLTAEHVGAQERVPPRNWVMDGEHFVVPSYGAIELMRAVARDDETIETFANAPVVLKLPDPIAEGFIPLRQMVSEEDHRLGTHALPVLYGLAVAGQLISVVSYHSWHAIAERAAEQASPSPPAEDSP